MKLTADRDGFPRYFSAKLGFRQRFDPKEIEMLSNGIVSELIPPESVQGRGNRTIRYNISAYSTLDFYVSCILSREQFADLLLQCIDVIRKMQKVYLDCRNLVLQPEYVYIDLQSRHIHFIYLPLANSRREVSVPDFFQQVIRKTGRSTYEQVSFLDACTAWIDRPAPFTLEEFDRFIREWTSNGTGETASAVAQSSPPLPPQVAARERIYQPIATPVQVPPTIKTQPLSPTGQGGTRLLRQPDIETPPAAPLIRFYLERLKTGERVEIQGDAFLVGSEAGAVSYLIADNPSVSRKHVRFSIRDRKCFATDQGSLNKTYRNDCLLAPYEEEILCDGDQLRLANELFKLIQEG